MFATAKTFRFFPSPVWAQDLEPDHAARLNGELETALDGLTASRPTPPPTGMWQTVQTLHRYREFAELVTVIEAASARALAEWGVAAATPLITGCWANINPSGVAHPAHNHANNFLSGVYYVRVPPGGDSISFHDPRAQRNIIAPATDGENELNASLVHLPAAPGRMILFPAWFVHSVRGFKGGGTRISISFNILFPSFGETLAAPKWSGLALDREPDQ